MSAKLLAMVLIEVIKRLMNSKGSSLNEPLGQIALNKYTVIKCMREVKREEPQYFHCDYCGSKQKK